MRSAIHLLTSALLLLLLGAGSTHAATARPVHVQGTALRDRLASLYFQRDPDRDQFDGGLYGFRRVFVGLTGLPIAQPFGTFLELFDLPPDVEVGIYNGHLAEPELIPVFPAGTTPGSFATFIIDPFRQLVRVSRFTPEFTLLSSITTPAQVDTNGVGLYIRSPRGTFFSQDARQPDHSPHVLWFVDVPFSSYHVLAWEDSPAAASDDDFDDVILGWQDGSEGPYTVSARHATWSRVKQLYR